MSLIKENENYLKTLLADLGYDTEVQILASSKKELGDFQINVAMQLAKKYHQNPIEIANLIVSKLPSQFENVNIASPGFINFTFSTSSLLTYLNKGITDFNNLIDKHQSKTIFLDYGGANAAKALHVGHMRSPNIGEAMRRLANLLGYKTISDVHLGDLGRQAGMIISEIKLREPDLPFFNENYQGPYPKVTYTPKELGEMYVTANISANNSSERMSEVREITAQIDKGNKHYLALWKQLVDISSTVIKEVYNQLNCHFDLFEGELDSFKDVPKMLEVMKPYLYESEKALVIDVKLETDNKEMPPLIVIKQDGATIYATRDLATIYSRYQRFSPDEIWYFTDNRQSLYFEQVFRASYKAKLVPPTCKLLHFSFGTINGSDGKPYKTRDGGVMELANLIQIIKDEITPKLKPDLENKQDISNKLTIATLKYADLMSNRQTDYIFDAIKFSSFEGKTGPYLLYTTVRLKSILSKANLTNYQITKIPNLEMKEILLKILELPTILNKSFIDKSLNHITDFLFELASLFNKFYNNYHILTELDLEIKNSYISLVKLVYQVIKTLLNTLAIQEVEKM